MKAFITGATGFVGSHVARALAEQGADLRLLVRPTSRTENIADLRAENGMLSWDRDVPAGALTNYSRSPIDFHDNNQVAGTPFYEEDRFLIKFANFWTFEMPAGYSLLITHPFNRHDLPFVTLTGLVDADSYCDNFINFPAASNSHATSFSYASLGL